MLGNIGPRFFLSGIRCARSVLPSLRANINLLLTERKGLPEEYWPEVVIERTERRKVLTKTTEGQYSPVRFEQAGLVSSLLYGTLVMPYIFLSYWGILARGCGSTDRWQRGLYENDRGPIFPSTVRASYVSK